MLAAASLLCSASTILTVTPYYGSTCSGAPAQMSAITPTMSGLDSPLSFASGGGCVSFNNGHDGFYGACGGAGSVTFNAFEGSGASSCSGYVTNAAKRMPTSFTDGQCWAAGGGSLHFSCASASASGSGGGSIGLFVGVTVAVLGVVMVLIGVIVMVMKKQPPPGAPPANSTMPMTPPLGTYTMPNRQEQAGPSSGVQMEMPTAPKSSAAMLKELKELLDMDVLTQSEFDAQKKKILEGMVS